MSKISDVLLTIGFLLLYGYYVLMGISFGGLSGDNQGPFVLLAIIGFALIIFSLTTKSIAQYALTRIGGIFVQTTLIYFDLEHSYSFELKLDFILNAIFYFPTLGLIIYLTCSLIRIIAINKELKQ